jgi:hypothetical protein
MEAVTVTCDKCGRTAFVHDAHYEYKEVDGAPASAADHILLAIVRNVECPDCGERTQREAFDGEPA